MENIEDKQDLCPRQVKQSPYFRGGAGLRDL